MFSWAFGFYAYPQFPLFSFIFAPHYTVRAPLMEHRHKSTQLCLPARCLDYFLDDRNWFLFYSEPSFLLQ